MQNEIEIHEELPLLQLPAVGELKLVGPRSLTSWLPLKIKSLLSSSESLARAKCAFKVTPEAADKNFK